MDTIKTQHLLISRTDAIGDVVLTLPLCGYIKQLNPQVKVSFLGRTYTQAVVATCQAVDEFINLDQLLALPRQQQITWLKAQHIDAVIHVYPNKVVGKLALLAGIKQRIGTTNRLHHWLSCNKLVPLSRKKSPLHEAQLNIALLRGLGVKTIPPLQQLPAYYQFNAPSVEPWLAAQLQPDRFNLIIHPKSNGSAREWTLAHYTALITLLPPQHYRVFITGAEKEQQLLANWMQQQPPHVVDLTGKLSLQQLIAFIAQVDGLLASSTGPLHLAAASGIHALGLFPSVQSINAGRWGPLGFKASYISSPADDMDSITPEQVFNHINHCISNES